MKKFELTKDCITVGEIKLFRIKALVELDGVEVGDFGGYVEKENNLSHDGDAWICDDAKVYGNSMVYEDAKVYGDARVCDDARVCGDAKVYGDARVCDDVKVHGDARVCGDAKVCGDADYMCIKGIGSECRNTTFFKTKDGGISVKCGCFGGTLAEFEAKVKETHSASKFAKEYLKSIELVKIHFEVKEEQK